MKKIIAILWLPKFLVVTLLFAACGSSADNEQGKNPNNNQPAGEKQAVETKITDIAYIRLDSVIQKYDYYHDLKREFEQKAKKKEDEFRSKMNALQADAKVFQEKYQKMLLTNSEAEEQRQRLEQRDNELRNVEYPKMMSELGEEEAVMSRKVLDAIQVYVEKYNVEKKYSLILNAATIMVGTPSMDVTSDILSGLNQEYIASKAKK
ncbi:MAG: OmpH family outer membrane protein [Prevotellaceae bacterium]|jgi:outer membrane protein|nr:OmpH family outer membrane protein [Prevotellaceae bacterium]